MVAKVTIVNISGDNAKIMRYGRSAKHNVWKGSLVQLFKERDVIIKSEVEDYDKKSVFKSVLETFLLLLLLLSFIQKLSVKYANIDEC